MGIPFKTKYAESKDANLHWNRYVDRTLALQIRDNEQGLLGTATVAITGGKAHILAAGLTTETAIIVKDYSENEGMLACLIKNDIVEPPVAEVQTGFVKVHVCKLGKAGLADLAIPRN